MLGVFLVELRGINSFLYKAQVEVSQCLPNCPSGGPYGATTRATVVNNKENTTSRAARASSRAKPPSTVTDHKAAAARVTASTVATRAKSHPAASHPDTATQGKRKREALGEVPRPPANVIRQNKESAAAKGKGKATKEAFDGVEIKKPVSTARGPHKVVASATSPRRR
ncbi:hypothetical protein NM688_g9265 [Phlebia brevispora]|uniref:Uncharacterized protein n=1 Tax=Phlebia brevispora TaxID=194682 RepID=A0ACC1RJI0_9APHY|nr:hypothetical protein NM688_g9265 [Phlebia brevispora]